MIVNRTAGAAFIDGMITLIVCVVAATILGIGIFIGVLVANDLGYPQSVGAAVGFITPILLVIGGIVAYYENN